MLRCDNHEQLVLTHSQKIRDRLLSTGPDLSGTLQLLVKNEGLPGDKKLTATEGLLWLLRYVCFFCRAYHFHYFSGLEFTARALRLSLENPSEELSTSFTKAYEITLRKYHSILVRPVFSVCAESWTIHFFPYWQTNA